MANLSDFTGNVPSTDDGIRVVSRFVTETEYENITAVSDPAGTLVPSDPDFDEFFSHTLYYISED